MPLRTMLRTVFRSRPSWGAALRGGLAALLLAPLAAGPIAPAQETSLGPATSLSDYENLFGAPDPVALKPLAAEPVAKTSEQTKPAPKPAAGAVTRAGFESAADAGSGVVRTAGVAERTPAVPAAFPASGAGTGAGTGVGRPVADLDFFFKPRGAAIKAEAVSEPVSEPSVGARTAAAPPVEAGPRASVSAFSAADFGFGPVAPPAATVVPAAATTEADGPSGKVKTVSGTDDPFADLADPFSPTPASEQSASGVTTADATADGAARPTVTPVSDAPVSKAPASDPFRPRRNPLAAPDPQPVPARVAEAAPAPAPVAQSVEMPAPVPAPERSAAPRPLATMIPVGADGGVGPQAAALSVRWDHDGPIRVGRVCTSFLTVANAGPATAYGATVVGDVSANMGLAAADPAPENGVDTANPTWTFPALAAGEERRIRLTYTPVAVGSTDENGEPNRLAALVTSGLVARSVPLVTEPKLTVELEGARDVLLGEPANQTILVSNPGTGSVDEVLIEAVLPEGLEHRGGPKRLTMNIGALSAGETKPVRLGLLTSAGGVQTIAVTVRGDGGLEASTEANVVVKSPQIELAIDGPGLRYVNRTAVMRLTVTNPGDAATDNVRLGYRVPDGFAFLAADSSGTHDPAGRTVRWFLGRVEAGGSLTVNVNLKASAGGEQVHRAEVSASNRAKASARHVTRVEGTASLVLKIQDSDDPVEVGSETEYTVTVANEGTAPAKTVGLACRVPEGTESGAVRGPAAHRTEGRLILFDSLPELAPGAKKVYTLRIKGLTPGSKRFQTRLVSESISEPLIHEEITKFYAE